MRGRKDPPVAFPSRQAWDGWLRKNHASSDGAWLQFVRRGTSKKATISHDDALAVALCYGWIDGQTQKLDAEHWLQRFTPRKADSRWSKINRAKAVELMKSGQLKPAGLKAIEQAQASGSWDRAYDGQRTAQVPEDLQLELERRPAAKAFFGALDSKNRYAILYRIQDAKKPETRARRIEKFVAMLAAREKIYP